MKISIRNAPMAKQGLRDLCDYMAERMDISKATMVEIGCYVGDSTEIFAQRFGKVMAVDPWRNGYDKNDAASYLRDMRIIEAQFDEMAKGFPNIEKQKMYSAQFVKKIDMVDVVYIDGLHTYDGCKNDIDLWKEKINHGGFLCGHDFQGKFPGVIRAVNEFRRPDKTFGDTSWVIQL